MSLQVSRYRAKAGLKLARCVPSVSDSRVIWLPSSLTRYTSLPIGLRSVPEKYTQSVSSSMPCRVRSSHSPSVTWAIRVPSAS